MGQRNFDKTGCSCERMKKMTTKEVINIAEDFNKWLEDMAEKYGWDKNDVQGLIKLLLV